MHVCICACKRQKRQVIILSIDKIVLAERPAEAAGAWNTDLEIRHPNQVRTSKVAAAESRLCRVFGPNGNNKYTLFTVIDRKTALEKRHNSGRL
jgi:hypothetical protein